MNLQTRKQAIEHIKRINKEFYVYVLYYNSVPFYVGKGKKLRFLVHEQEAKNNYNRYVHKKIRKIWREDGEIKYDISFETNKQWLALHYEQTLIAKFRRVSDGGTLTNLTDGGDGSWGASVSRKTRLKMSKSRMGRIVSEETREKISRANLGRVHSVSFGQKISRILKGRKLSEETRLKMSVSRIGLKHTEEAKRKISATRLISAKVKAANERNKIPVIIFGKIYPSVREAGIEFGMNHNSIAYWVKVGKNGSRRLTEKEEAKWRKRENTQQIVLT